MKRQFVASLQEGDTVNDYFLAVRKDVRDQSNGGKFLGMVFKDRTGEVGGILWTNAVAVARLFEVGDVVNVRGNVREGVFVYLAVAVFPDEIRHRFRLFIVPYAVHKLPKRLLRGIAPEHIIYLRIFNQFFIEVRGREAAEYEL